MKALLAFIVVILVLGGVITSMAGHFWYETAKLLRFFGKDVNEAVGFKVGMAGLAAMLAGFGLGYLFL